MSINFNNIPKNMFEYEILNRKIYSMLPRPSIRHENTLQSIRSLFDKHLKDKQYKAFKLVDTESIKVYYLKK